jgi:urease accessory protein
MKTRKPLLRLAVTAVSLLPAVALAHPGHGETSGFAAGALHPLGGLDHLIALVAVGVLAARLNGRWLAPPTAALLGIFVAAFTADSDGWRYAAGFMATSAALIAAGVAATRLPGLAISAMRVGS